MHIGVCTQGFVSWGGGVGFIENILVGLTAVPDKVTKITVFVPAPPTLTRRLAGRIKRAVLQPSHAIQHLTSADHSLVPWQTAPELFAKICSEVVCYDGTTKNLSQLSTRLQVDVMLPCFSPAAQFGTPWVGYLYDCQHRYYPQFFETKEVARRDQNFSQMLLSAESVIVNAKSVVDDLNMFFPNKKASIVALPFSPLMRAKSMENIDILTAFVKSKYATGERYLMISNQFWIHKDHETAFKAFALAVKSDLLLNYKLICTGEMNDCRFPGYFHKLQKSLSSLNIRDKVIFTGYVDKLDQLALLNGAALMIQPTLFEGGPGGGAAYDAVALGVPSILSDIPVNLEISDPVVRFFKAGDAQSLAAEIISAIDLNIIRQSFVELVKKSNDYARELGLALHAIASRSVH